MSETVTSTEPSSACLSSGSFVDSDHAQVKLFAHHAVGQASDPAEQAKRLYYRVRDDFRYDAYTDFVDPKSYRASTCIAIGKDV